MKLEGVFLPVTTPFDEETGEAAPIAFRANLRAWLEQGVHGFVIAGSTGEAPLLDEGEIVRLVEWARDVVPAERGLIVGIGSESTRATLRLGREVAGAGADAVLVRPPAYYRSQMTPDALRHHFETLADALPIPLVLYHVPVYVPVEISAGLLGEMIGHSNVIGIKDSTGDLKSLGQFLDAAGREGSVLVGAGHQLYAALEMGAAGGVVAAGCIAPGLAIEVHDRFREGEVGVAGRVQGRLSTVHTAIVRGLGVPGVKYALDLLGYVGGPPRPPLLPLNDDARSRVRSRLEEAGLLTNAT